MGVIMDIMNRLTKKLKKLYLNKNECFFDLCSNKFVDNLGNKYFESAWNEHKYKNNTL